MTVSITSSSSAVKAILVRSRAGNFARRQRAGRDLVQQRLKGVIIVAINQRHLDGSGLQGLCGPEVAKPTAHDDDAPSLPLSLHTLEARHRQLHVLTSAIP